MNAEFRVIAPRRDGFRGISVAGYFWQSDAATSCLRLDAEDDQPADATGRRRIGTKTYGRLLAAQEVGRLIVTSDPGEQGMADTAAIARLTRELAQARAAHDEASARADALTREAVELRREVADQRGAVVDALARADAAGKRADELAAKLEAATKAPEIKARAVSK